MARKRRLSQEPYDETDEAFIYLYSRLPFLIHRVNQILTAMFEGDGQTDVTLPQFQLLDLLARAGASAQIDLARKAGIDAATTGLVLGNLHREGLVVRRLDIEDSRRKIVAITEAGRRVLAIAARRNRALDRKIGERLGGEARFLRMLLDRQTEPAASDARVRSASVRSTAETAGLRDVALKLRRWMQISERKFADAVGPLDITMRQFAVLYVMRAIPRLTTSDVVRLLGYEASNAGLIIRILHEKALIEVVNGATRRHFRITAAGKRKLHAAHSLAIDAELALAKVLGLRQSDFVAALRLLGNIVRHFDKDMRRPIPTFVAVQSQRRWPMPPRPVPAVIAGPRTTKASKRRA